MRSHAWPMPRSPAIFAAFPYVKAKKSYSHSYGSRSPSGSAPETSPCVMAECASIATSPNFCNATSTFLQATKSNSARFGWRWPVVPQPYSTWEQT